MITSIVMLHKSINDYRRITDKVNTLEYFQDDRLNTGDIQTNNSYNESTSGENQTSIISASRMAGIKYYLGKIEVIPSIQIIFYGVKLVISLFFVVLETFLVIYALSIALRCTKNTTQRIVHSLLAVTAPIPYLLSNASDKRCVDNVSIIPNVSFS